MIKSSFCKCLFLTTAAVLVFASAAFSQVTIVLTGVNGSYAGSDPTVYTDPYYGTINGTATTIMCDDYADDNNIGDTWQANVTTVATVTTSNTTKWIGDGATVKITPTSPTLTMNTQTLYDGIAYLSTQMLGASSGAAQEAYSFALWQLTCTYGNANPNLPAAGQSTCGSTTPFSTIGGALLTAAENDLNAALSQNYTPGEYSNVTIYTPTFANNVDPQEFISVPEASTIAMLGADLLCLLAMAFFFRRRVLQPIS